MLEHVYADLVTADLAECNQDPELLNWLELGQNSGFEECFHRRQYVFVLDPHPHPIHESAECEIESL
ncbi:hypothetical protein [Saccharopolyspora hattusasensis]|uniref:hypothetical protein n=1 Tax=Saccharopolyspora hattusasensis TaxID=1128679 RepID=UPI003D996B57